MTEDEKARARTIVTDWMAGANKKRNFDTIKVLFEISDALSDYEPVSSHPDRNFIANWLEKLKVPATAGQKYDDWVFMCGIFGDSTAEQSENGGVTG